MIYEPISSVATIEPKEFPLYATDCYRASGPSVKFHKRGHAKAALRNKMSYYGRNNSISDISIYKYNFETELYEKIFDSKSQLASAFVSGKISADDMINAIDW